VRVDVEPLGDRPFRVDARLRPLPGLGILSAEMSEFRLARTGKLVADGNNDFRLSVNISGSETVAQRGRDVALGAGDATLISMAETGTIVRSSAGQRLGLQIPFNELALIVVNVADAVLRPIPSNNGALELLMRYLRVLDEDALATP
jgi:hypothetical protein